MKLDKLKNELVEIKNLDEQEKFLELLNESKVTLDNQPPKPDVLLKMGGVDMFTCGDLSAVVSKAGHGKSTLLSLVCGEMINTKDSFFESELKDERPILYFDTEMSDYDVWRITHRLNKLTGLESEELQKRFEVFKTEHLGDDNRKNFIMEVVKMYKPQFVIIDGVTDLIGSINDEAIAKKTVSEFRAIANEFKCHILAVIHSNEGNLAGTEARGWIGKEWKRKAEGEINVKFDNKEFKVSCGKGRHGRFDDWTFELDQTTKAPYFTGKKEKTEVETNRESATNAKNDIDIRNELAEELSNRVDVIDICRGGSTQGAIVEILKTMPGVGKTQAETLVKLMVTDGKYFKREGNKVHLVDNKQIGVFGDNPDEPDLPF